MVKVNAPGLMARHMKENGKITYVMEKVSLKLTKARSMLAIGRMTCEMAKANLPC